MKKETKDFFAQKSLKLQTNITLDEEVVIAIKRLAEKDDRSFSSYINRVLKEHIREND